MRLTDRALLHPAFRERTIALEGHLMAESISLHRYEGARTPWRQAELFARGRTIPHTKIVTYSQPFESRHCFGLAEDYVFRLGDRRLWTWSVDEKREPALAKQLAKWWERFIELTHKVELQHASDIGLKELPHVQLEYPLTHLKRGLYPPGGDDSWASWLDTQIETWGTMKREHGGWIHPGAPPPTDIDERPEMEKPEAVA